LGGGRLIKYSPYPVVSGYLSGVGVLIFLSQLQNLFGVPKGTKLWDTVTSPALWQNPSLVVGLTTIATVLLASKFTRKIPATICGLIVGTLAYFGMSFFHPELLNPDHTHLIIGPLSGNAHSILSGLPAHWAALGTLRWADLTPMLVHALTLSVLLSIDTLKTCVVVDSLTMSRHKSDRELFGQGAGNVVSALFGGMPGSGTMGATLVNLESGGLTRLSGVLEGIFVLAAFLLVGSWIAWVPMAALSGILIVVAFRMFDWHTFQLLRRPSTVFDFCVIATVIIVAVQGSLIAASGTGLALSIVLFIRDQIRSSVIHRKISGTQIFSTQQRLPEEQKILAENGYLTTVCDLQGNLFFGTTDQLFTELEPDLKKCRYLILDLRRVQSFDYTAAHLLQQFETIMKSHNGYLIFSHLAANLPTGKDLRTYFSEVGIMRPNVRKFETLDDALQWVEDQILAEKGFKQIDTKEPLPLTEINLIKEFINDPAFDIFAAGLKECNYSAGEVIFTAGDPGDQLFFIRQGIVRIVLPLPGGNYHNLASFGRGDFFGELAFLDSGPRSANAIATKETQLFVISRAHFDAIFKTHPVIGVKILTRLARDLAMRLRRADSELCHLHEA